MATPKDDGDPYEYILPTQVVLIVCKRCSVMVWSKGDHERWHIERGW